MVSYYTLWWSDVKRMLPRKSGAIAKALAMMGTQGIWAVTMFRLGAWISTFPRILRLPVNLLYRPMAKLVQCLTGIDLPTSAQIGEGLYIGHFGSIILHGEATLGSFCNLSQNVTVGISGFGERRGVPIIGNRVYLGPGAKVFGPITLGDGCIVGANAVVNRSFPPGSILVGVPAVQLRQASPDEIHEIIFGDQGADYPTMSSGSALPAP